MLKYINSWCLPNWVRKLILWYLNLNKAEIIKGDIIQSYGIGYPGMKGKKFLVSAVFEDKQHALIGEESGQIKVSLKDFKKVEAKLTVDQFEKLFSIDKFLHFETKSGIEFTCHTYRLEVYNHGDKNFYCFDGYFNEKLCKSAESDHAFAKYSLPKKEACDLYNKLLQV